MKAILAAVVLLVPPTSMAGDLAEEPVVYVNGKAPYTALTRPRLLALHKQLAASLGSRVQLRVTPYWADVNASVIKAELLGVYYQEKSADLAVVRGNMKKVADTVFKTLGTQLGKDSSVTFYARLPEGKTIRDFKVETNANCLDKNTVMEQINTADYAPAPAAERLVYLCNIPGEQELDARFLRKDFPFDADLWRTTEVKP
jgi:hypothetical protein